MLCLQTYAYAGGFNEGQDLTWEGSVIESIEPYMVCMVNYSVMGKPQISVYVDEKTYYGCCQGCVSRMQGERVVRYAVDPVTGHEVNKADAVHTEGNRGGGIVLRVTLDG